MRACRDVRNVSVMKILVAWRTSSDLIMKTMDGHLDANITDGALEGIDLAYRTGYGAASLIDRDSRAGTSREHANARKFDAFKVTADSREWRGNHQRPDHFVAGVSK